MFEILLDENSEADRLEKVSAGQAANQQGALSDLRGNNLQLRPSSTLCTVWGAGMGWWGRLLGEHGQQAKG